ncbi:MAG TPA: translocation/assembly module TamB domain-containing protein, partial [Kiloniellales bacterium]|nr:translocation/assembly module TamB domain-containing protein [Kiloniellales bacterium]
IDGRYDLALENAEVLTPALGVALSGRAGTAGTLTGPIGDPQVSGRLTSPALMIAGTALRELALDYRVANLADAPRGHLQAELGLPSGPINARTDFALETEALRLTALSLGSRGTQGSGELTVPLSGAPLSGRLAFEAGSLAPWLELAGLAGDGRATGTLSLTAREASQAAKIDGEASDLTLDLGEGAPFAIGSLALDADLAGITATPQGEARIAAQGIRRDALRLDDLALDVRGTAQGAQFRLETTGQFQEPLMLRAEGEVERNETRIAVALSRADGRAFGQDLALQRPLRLTQEGESLALEDLDLAIGDARARGSASLGSERLAADLSVADLPLSVLAPFGAPADLTGRVSAELALDGPRTAPQGTAKVSAEGLRHARLDKAPPLGLALEAIWRDRRLAVSGRLSGTPERDATLEAELPLALDPETLALSLPSEAPLTAELDWRGDAASLWALAPLPDHRLAGATELAVSLSGSLAAPELSGRIGLSNGRYENLETGTLLRDLTLDLALEDRRAVIETLSATDGANGRLEGRGEIALNGDAGRALDLRTNFTDFVLLRRDEVTASADGQLTLEGSLTDSLLAGTIETRRVEIRIPDRLPAEVVKLDVEETEGSQTGGAEAGAAETSEPETGAGKSEQIAGVPRRKPGRGRSETAESLEPAEPSAGPTIRLDLTLEVPRRAFVRWRGLDSEWGGAFRITGTAAQPKIDGEIAIVRGQLTFLTKTFDLVRGNLRFAGTDLDPELDIVAEHKAKSITARARVTGSASNPKISLSSTPELPQDEIVSRILFDKGTTQLSALEAAQLAQAAASLTGRGGGPDILGMARDALGVDVLRV